MGNYVGKCVGQWVSGLAGIKWMFSCSIDHLCSFPIGVYFKMHWRISKRHHKFSNRTDMCESLSRVMVKLDFAKKMKEVRILTNKYFDWDGISLDDQKGRQVARLCQCRN